MRMSKNLVLCAAILSLLLGVAHAQSVSGALSIANAAVQPSTIVAGSNITVFFQLYNNYDDALHDVNLQLSGSYPLLTFSPSNNYLISTIGSGLYPGYLFYNVTVPATTPTGTYALSFQATYRVSTPTSGTVIGTSTMPFSVYVHGIPNVTAAVSGTQMTSGNALVATVTLSNTGYSKASDVSVTFLNTTALTVSGTRSFSAAELQNRSSLGFSVTYAVNGKLSSGTYAVPVLVSYRSDYNATYTRQINLTASVVVNSPNVKAFIAGAQPSALYRGYNQTVQIAIENTGLGAAKNVTVSLQPGVGMTLLSSVTTFFIADLEPGQAVVEPVLVTSSGSANATIAASISGYSSNYQNRFSSVQPLNLSLAPSAQFSISFQGSALQPGAAGVPLTFRITNTGTIDAKEVQLSLQTTYPVTPVASSSYIADLAPGQSTNATFVVSVDTSGVTGNYPVIVYEQWKQPNGSANQQFSGSDDYFVSVAAASFEFVGDIEIAIVVVVAAMLVMAVYRRVKASRGKKEKGKESK